MLKRSQHNWALNIRVLWRVMFIVCVFSGYVEIADAQWTNTYVFKVEPTAPFFNEFRFILERNIGSKDYFYFPPSGESKTKQAFKSAFASRRGKYWEFSMGYYYRNNEELGERQHGPVGRIGLRSYFNEMKAPSALYAYFGLNYGLLYFKLFDKNYNTLNTQFVHRPGASLALGKQWLFGLSKSLAVDLFAGFEFYYSFSAKSLDTFSLRNKPGFAPFVGLQLGLAFYPKKNPWR